MKLLQNDRRLHAFLVLFAMIIGDLLFEDTISDEVLRLDLGLRLSNSKGLTSYLVTLSGDSRTTIVFVVGFC